MSSEDNMIFRFFDRFSLHYSLHPSFPSKILDAKRIGRNNSVLSLPLLFGAPNSPNGIRDVYLCNKPYALLPPRNRPAPDVSRA